MTKLLALAASFRPDSLNGQLIDLSTPIAEKAGAQVTRITYEQCEAPLYRDIDQPLPEGAQFLADRLLAHDGLLLASPEYNWSLPGSLKNLIDWLSTDKRKPLAGRTALIMCASPSTRGGISGLQHLRVPLEVLGMWVYPQMIGIGSAHRKLDDGTLMSGKEQAHFTSCIRDFVRATGALRA
jgi:NAD(P)H-dependent FMN reductase